MKRRILIFLAIILFSHTSQAWGFFAHRIIHQLAIYSLPKSMQAFYFANQKELVDNAVRPDKRRNNDPDEAPRHFIDVDYYGDSAAWTMPERWSEAAGKYSADTLIKYGYLPWRVDFVRQRLTEAMRRADRDSILFYSADLGHYVADAHVPFHATLNYDGQLTGQRGIHSFWESKLPELFIGEYDLRQDRPRYLADPLHSVWNAVRGSFVLVKPALELEKRVSQQIAPEAKFTSNQFGGRTYRNYSDAFARLYHPGVEGAVARRMRDAAQAVASFWLTCWQDAGRPDLTVLTDPKSAKGNAKKFRLERRAWKRNQLYAQKLLLIERGE